MYTVRELGQAAATAGTLAGPHVWLARPDGRLGAYRPDGTSTDRLVDSPPVAAAAGTADLLVIVTQNGEVVLRDATDGAVRQHAVVPGDVTIASDGARVWVADHFGGRVGELRPDGLVSRWHDAGAVAALAADGDQCWWTQAGSTVLFCSDGRRVDLGGIEPASPLVACSGAVWLGDEGGLQHIGTWRGEAGAPLPHQAGPLAVLGCAGGRLVGAGPSAAFVLDPRVDEDVHLVNAALPGHPVGAFGTLEVAWIVTDGGTLLFTR